VDRFQAVHIRLCLGTAKDSTRLTGKKLITIHRKRERTPSGNCFRGDAHGKFDTFTGFGAGGYRQKGEELLDQWEQLPNWRKRKPRSRWGEKGLKTEKKTQWERLRAPLFNKISPVAGGCRGQEANLESQKRVRTREREAFQAPNKSQHHDGLLRKQNQRK